MALRRLPRLISATIISLCLATSLSFAAFPYHTFDEGNDGWTVAGATTTYIAPTIVGGSAPWDSRGNPGGALAVTDLQSETWVAAPAAFLGNQSDMYGKSFSYDILIRFTDNAAYPTAAITGNGLSLIFTNGVPPLNQWQTRVVPFDESVWHVGSATGAIATQTQLKSVLESLTGLYLLIEWRTGPDDTSIDNVGIPGVATALLGDFNNDHAVDGLDYTVWRNNFGDADETDIHNNGDGGDVAEGDFDLWKLHYGDTGPGAGGSAANPASPIPEPSQFALLSLAALGGQLFVLSQRHVA